MTQLATVQGKEHALKMLSERRAKAKETKPIDNSSLPAGSPMHYYCISCGLVADVLPELHVNAPRRLCTECQALKDLGWLE